MRGSLDKMVKIAFFDFSRTIAKGTGFGAGPIFLNREKEYNELYEKYQAKKLDEVNFIKSVGELWKDFKEKDISKIYSKIELNPNVKNTLKKLKKRDIKLALVSNIPIKLAEFYKNLGFDFVSGTTFETRNGIFTGKVLKINSDKFRIVNSICNHAKISPKECIAIGDSIGDIGMFKAVGYNNSFAYNAKSKVKKYAKYNIKDFKEIIKIFEK